MNGALSACTPTPPRPPPEAPLSTLDRAKSAILARLWAAATREPLPDITRRQQHDATTTITTRQGHTLSGPTALAAPFADPHTHTPITLDGTPLHEPTTLATTITSTHPHSTQLRDDINEAVHGLALAYSAAQPHPHHTQLWTTARQRHPDPSVYFEQIVIDGHPLHPLSRDRAQLTEAQTRAYAPEHRQDISLAMVLLRPNHTHQHGTWPYHHQHQPLLPLHPWQHEQHPIAPAHHHIAAAPLMSLRTLAPHSTPHLHIKTAVDLRLTSATRHVSAAATHNGPILSRLLAQLTHNTCLAIQQETGSLSQLDQGTPNPALSAIARQSPHAILPPSHIAVPLAALAARDPYDGRPLISDIIATSHLNPHTWWHACLTHLILPLLQLRIHYGIAAEAHGQNTLLTVHNGRPVGAVYRDLGGIRLHRPELPPHLECPPLHGDLECPDPHQRDTKLIAALYTVAIHQLVDALTDAYQEPPHTWWKTVTTISQRATHQHPRLHNALFAPTWPIKATTAMRIAHQPTQDQWATIPNPLNKQ